MTIKPNNSSNYWVFSLIVCYKQLRAVENYWFGILNIEKARYLLLQAISFK